ncbi:glucosamine-6-phosphate deaminase [Corynebacterium diphtheriae]|uniref:glucosamine-6-phosphate deaminase n=1 Tax=Corynebacterium diphtheriae TaxID=1717 RepID=UPI000246957F|nr:glucosamine-6-phosphate deaminase [Corynebacterium diphtheriae]AEX82676.1 putative isomerase [Corynebacterium diphtheriae VA01]CAB0495659.1 glucosamine-6-phosphate deaminase [Corynebacterium diphtheriae]
MEIVITPTKDDAARIAADILEEYAREGKTLGLATGSTPLGTYQELIRRHNEEGLSFAECQAFTLDEYVGLPREHEQSYYSTIRREFTSHIDIPDEKVFNPDGTAEHPGQAAQEYDRLIVEKGGVDIQILGIGTDGHIAFNEPTSSMASRTRIKTLHPDTVRDNSRFFDGDKSQVPHHVMTQGIGTIREARHLLMLCFGENKADAVKAMVEGPVAAVCPASVLQLHEHATVVVDEAAAAKLEHTQYYRYALENKPDWQRF